MTLLQSEAATGPSGMLPNVGRGHLTDGLLRFSNQPRGLDLKGCGQQEDGSEGGGSVAPFDQADECRVPVAGERQFLLREPASDP